MLNLVAAAAFATFVAAAFRVAHEGLPEQRRRRVNTFLVVLLTISFATGLTQRELWPFSSWPLVAGVLEDEVTHGRIVAVDRDGVEHDVDYRAWQPLSFDELMAWMDAVFPMLDAAAKDRTAAHLVSLAEQSRRRVIAGDAAGSTRAVLGPLSAPSFILHPRRWTDRAKVPPVDLVGLRYFHETWSLSERARGGTDVRRKLVFEFPRP